MEAPDGAEYLEVFFDAGYFPAGTRFILNNGQELLLEEEQSFVIPVNGKSIQLLLINVANVAESHKKDSAEILVTANGADGTEYSFDSVQINLTQKPMEFPAKSAYAVLSQKASLKISCAWDATDVEYTIERLDRDENGKIAWIEGEYELEVKLPDNNATEEARLLTISNEGGKAPVGCYRITVQRFFLGLVAAEAYQLFFVHY